MKHTAKTAAPAQTLALTLALALGLIGALSLGAPRLAQAILIDFEEFEEGERVTSHALPDGISISVENGRLSHPDAAIIFDSSCTGGCTGNDTDLQTPGSGPGNDTAQGNVLIIAEDVEDVNGDGLVDDPDDELNGGVITFTFDRPHKLITVRAVDFEATEVPSQIEVVTVSGGLQIVPFTLLGNNSAETVTAEAPQGTQEIRFVFEGTGAIDELEIDPACGDGILDPGEQCDPPASQGGNASCDDNCQITGPFCGNNSVDPGENCDPPASMGGAANCNDDCQESVCGDSNVQAGEVCDPPASMGGAANCNDDCTPSVCGDGDVEAGEQCDPPGSQGGAADCDDLCQLVPMLCGDGNVDPPAENCDPPASQGGAATCNDDCQSSVCGDSDVGAGEECDPPGSQGGSPTCNDDCTNSVCGDSTVEAGEECDPPASQGGDGDCRDDCTRAVCGNDEVEPSEQCDPPASQGGVLECADDCTVTICGDGVIQGAEQCDPPASAGGFPACDDNCQLTMDCGNGVVDAGEECDPPDGVDCDSNCQRIPRCGNGIVDPGEQCDPPSPEDCLNGIDDNGDTKHDCQDPLCAKDTIAVNPVCSLTCTEQSECKKVLRDPAVIRFGKDGKPGRFSMHGRTYASRERLNPTQESFGVAIYNEFGVVYQAFLEPGDLKPRGRGGRRYFFKDKTATDGRGIRNGLAKISARFRVIRGEEYLAFRIRAYGNFDKATVPLMTTQIYGVDDVAYLTAEWNRKSNGWILHFRDLITE